MFYFLFWFNSSGNLLGDMQQKFSYVGSTSSSNILEDMQQKFSFVGSTSTSSSRCLSTLVKIRRVIY